MEKFWPIVLLTKLLYLMCIAGTLISPIVLIISPNKEFSDIMVLASPPRPHVDPDDVNTPNSKNIQPISLKCYMWVIPPRGTCY